jgi:hypothetical protein
MALAGARPLLPFTAYMDPSMRSPRDAPTAVTESEPDNVVIPDAAPTDAPPEGGARAKWDALRRWAGGLRPAWKGFFAFLIYQVLAFAIWVIPILPRFGSQHIGEGLQDSRQFQWYMTWTPWALLHHLNPLHSDYVFAPGGANLAWFAFIPGPAIVAWPITKIFGPMAALNTVMAVAPALAAWAAYLLCDRITGRFWPSLIGGYLFGFSAYTAANMIGFINLILIFPVPLLVYLVIRRTEGSYGPVAFVAAFAACLVALFSASTELFGTATIFLGFAFVVAVIFAGRIRRELLKTGTLVVLAGAIAGVLLLPYVADVIRHAPAAPLNPPERANAADLWTFVLPSPMQAVGGRELLPYTMKHVLLPKLDGFAYMGIGVLLMLVGFAVTEWRRRETWLLLGFVGIVSLLTLGPTLHVGTQARGSLPGKLLFDLPLIQSAIPVRFAAYSALAIGVIAALWLARASGPFAWVRWAIVVIAALMLLPISPHHSDPNQVPAFFTSGAVEGQIGHDENVYAIGVQRGDELVWQEASGYWFRLAEAYLGPLPQELRTGPLSQGLNLRKSSEVPPAGIDAASWLRQHQVSAVILDDMAASVYAQMLRDAGSQPVYQGEGVSVWRPTNGTWTIPAAG